MHLNRRLWCLCYRSLEQCLARVPCMNGRSQWPPFALLTCCLSFTCWLHWGSSQRAGRPCCKSLSDVQCLWMNAAEFLCRACLCGFIAAKWDRYPVPCGAVSLKRNLFAIHCHKCLHVPWAPMGRSLYKNTSDISAILITSMVSNHVPYRGNSFCVCSACENMNACAAQIVQIMMSR